MERSVFNTCFMAKFDISFLVPNFSCKLPTFFAVFSPLRKNGCFGALNMVHWFEFYNKIYPKLQRRETEVESHYISAGGKKSAEKVHVRNVFLF